MKFQTVLDVACGNYREEKKLGFEVLKSFREGGKKLLALGGDEEFYRKELFLSDVAEVRSGLSRESLLEQRRNQMKETKRRLSDHSMIAAEADSPGKMRGCSISSETVSSSEVDYEGNISIFRQHKSIKRIPLAGIS